MIEIKIPGFNDDLTIEHLMLDFNGTLAVDGKLMDGLKEKLNELSQRLTIHVLTGNTFGTVEEELKGVNCVVVPLPSKDLGKEKDKYIRKFDISKVVSIGNGRNDTLMLKTSVIGIVVIQKEGASSEAMQAADIVCPDIFSALELFTNPLRLVATLRN